MAQILIVEDNHANMMLAIFLLQSKGHTVLCATDAEEGLALAKSELPDLILMDIQLPGIDGIEAIGILKENDTTKRIPVIALTALAMKGDEERIRAAGGDGYIDKPISYVGFLATVAQHLESGVSTIPEPGAPPLRILVVDDEPDNRELLNIILTRDGFTFESAASGKEALASMVVNPPALVLLDVMMPEMNGYEVVAKMKSDAKTKAIPVIMVSALSDRNSQLRAMHVGADGFLAKPLDRETLCAHVRTLLSGS